MNAKENSTEIRIYPYMKCQCDTNFQFHSVCMDYGGMWICEYPIYYYIHRPLHSEIDTYIHYYKQFVIIYIKWEMNIKYIWKKKRTKSNRDLYDIGPGNNNNKRVDRIHLSSIFDINIEKIYQTRNGRGKNNNFVVILFVWKHVH